MSTPTISTPLTKLFGIQHPILLAGMNVAAGPELAAAVTNAGGMGVIGGVGYTPEFLTRQIASLKVNNCSCSCCIRTIINYHLLGFIERQKRSLWS